MTKLHVRLLGALLALVSAGHASAASDHGCELESELRAPGPDGRLSSTSAALPDGLAYLGRRPSDGAIVALVPDGDEYREIGLYWPTPMDPVYAYRRMRRLPRDSTILGNRFDQTIIVLRTNTEFVVRGEKGSYAPIDYAGHVLSIDGCGGNDDLHGGEGSDHLFDYSGDNEFRGYGGRDWLEGTGAYFGGGAGDDCVTGDGNGRFAQLYGDEGNDALESTGAAGSTHGGEGTDTCSGTSSVSCENTGSAVCLGWF